MNGGGTSSEPVSVIDLSRLVFGPERVYGTRVPSLSTLGPTVLSRPTPTYTSRVGYTGRSHNRTGPEQVWVMG